MGACRARRVAASRCQPAASHDSVRRASSRPIRPSVGVGPTSAGRPIFGRWILGGRLFFGRRILGSRLLFGVDGESMRQHSATLRQRSYTIHDSDSSIHLHDNQSSREHSMTPERWLQPWQPCSHAAMQPRWEHVTFREPLRCIFGVARSPMECGPCRRHSSTYDSCRPLRRNGRQARRLPSQC
jgi:hypothetical protein